MMDVNATITLITHSIIALMLVGGGIFAIWQGSKLFREGVGLQSAPVEVEISKLKIGVSTVGGVMMLTACGWGWLASQTLPSYATKGDDVQIAENIYRHGQAAFAIQTGGDQLFFNYASAQLNPSSEQLLQRQAEWLQRNPNQTLTIMTLAAPEEGPPETRLALEARRSNTLRNLLVQFGVPAQRINTMSVGQEQIRATDGSTGTAIVSVQPLPSAPPEFQHPEVIHRPNVAP